MSLAFRQDWIRWPISSSERIWPQYRTCSQSSSLTSNRWRLGYGPFSRPARTCLSGCGHLSTLCEIGRLPPRMQRQMWRAEQSRQEMRGRFLVTVIATKPPQGDLYPWNRPVAVWSDRPSDFTRRLDDAQALARRPSDLCVHDSRHGYRRIGLLRPCRSHMLPTVAATSHLACRSSTGYPA